MQAEKKCCLIENTAFCKMLKTHLSMSDICHYLNVKGSNKRPREIHYKCKINTSRKGFLIKTNNNNKYDSADNKSSKVACMNACKKKVAIYEMKLHILKSLCQIPPYKYSFMEEVQMLRIIYTRVVPTDLIIIKERRFLCGLLRQLGRCLQAPAMASSGVQVPDWCLSEHKW